MDAHAYPARPFLRPLRATARVLFLPFALLQGCGGNGSSAVELTPPVAVAPDPAAQAGGPNCLFNAASEICKGAAAGLPYVLYSSRSEGAQDAAVNTDIVAVMSEALERASVNATAITVRGEDGVAIPGTVDYDATRNALVFRQQQELTAQRYTATVAAAVRDAAGNAMGRPYSWRFKVDAARRDSDNQRSIQQILDRAAFTFQIPGASMAIRDTSGKTWATTSGYADLTARAPVTADMRFRIGSNTKTLVATLILQLSDAGKLKLDDPINTYLPTAMATYMPAYDGNRITLRHLLNHTSGIANFTTDPVWGEAFVSAPYQQYSPLQLLQIANSHANDPGAPQFGNFFYANTNYILLGLVVGVTSGMPYEDAVANGITLPQNLPGILVPRIGEATLPAPFSHGYWQDPETGLMSDVTVRDASTVWSSGNVLSTIGELARWGELLGKGSLLAPATQAQRLQYVTMSENLRYGLGIVKDEGANLIGHQGGMIGYTSQVYYVPDTGYTLAFFYNRTLALHDYSAVMTYDVLNVLWPNRDNSPLTSSSRLRLQQVPPRAPLKPGFLTEY